ncbi:hypothetical protein DH2020_038430 [Rehmannia glutinosa]|uniref:TFIID subunit TAF5 NTD2 domain-containing protein n=1 Tax=Rehmannia glutinosa TaxID=99300 RepID=A0ABR0UZB3_REHGL
MASDVERGEEEEESASELLRDRFRLCTISIAEAEEEIDKVVMAYLDKRGFKQAGLAFQQEKQQHGKGSNASATAQIDPDIAKQILALSEVDSPAQYQEGYSKLRSWAYSSLDQYQVAALAHRPSKGNERNMFFFLFFFSQSLVHGGGGGSVFSGNRWFIATAIAIHELVRVLYPVFLHGFMDLVAKGHIQEVSPGQPNSIADDAEYVTLFGSDQDAANLINLKEIHWGQLLEDSLEEKLEKAVVSNMDSEKADGEMKEGELEENKKRSVDGGKQGTTQKKQKKDKVVGATAKVNRSENVAVSGAPRVKPELALPVIPVEVEHSILEDLRNRVQLNSVTLPSVSFYTFINTHNGYAYTLIWYTGEDELAPNDHMPSSNAGGRTYTLFRGHAGPVHSATFSPFGDYLLSSSSDSTNLCIIPMQFSPVGHYFASASHDRTARIWSMDRIQPLRIMAGHLSDVDCVQWHANCNYIATGSSDKTVRLWDVQSGECVRIFVGHRSMVLCLAMSPDGRYMASGDEDGKIMMWDLSSGRCVSPLVGHGSCIWSLAFSCEGSLLASGSADCTVKIWDVTTSSKVPKAEENKSGSAGRLRSLKTLPTKSTPVYALQYDPGPKRVGSDRVISGVKEEADPWNLVDLRCE